MTTEELEDHNRAVSLWLETNEITRLPAQEIAWHERVYMAPNNVAPPLTDVEKEKLKQYIDVV
jgi:hypothetical protein